MTENQIDSSDVDCSSNLHQNLTAGSRRAQLPGCCKVNKVVFSIEKMRPGLNTGVAKGRRGNQLIMLMIPGRLAEKL